MSNTPYTFHETFTCADTSLIYCNKCGKLDRHFRNKETSTPVRCFARKSHDFLRDYRIVLLEHCKPDALLEREAYWICTLHTLIPHGLNSAYGKPYYPYDHSLSLPAAGVHSPHLQSPSLPSSPGSLTPLVSRLPHSPRLQAPSLPSSPGLPHSPRLQASLTPLVSRLPHSPRLQAPSLPSSPGSLTPLVSRLPHSPRLQAPSLPSSPGSLTPLVSRLPHSPRLQAPSLPSSPGLPHSPRLQAPSLPSSPGLPHSPRLQSPHSPSPVVVLHLLPYLHFVWHLRPFNCYCTSIVIALVP